MKEQGGPTVLSGKCVQCCILEHLAFPGGQQGGSGRDTPLGSRFGCKIVGTRTLLINPEFSSRDPGRISRRSLIRLVIFRVPPSFAGGFRDERLIKLVNRVFISGQCSFLQAVQQLLPDLRRQMAPDIGLQRFSSHAVRRSRPSRFLVAGVFPRLGLRARGGTPTTGVRVF